MVDTPDKKKKKPPSKPVIVIGSNPGTGTTSGTTGITSDSYKTTAAEWAEGFLKYINAKGTVGPNDPRVQFIMAWMQTEATWGKGNSWNPLSIEYHGTDTQSKKRWNSWGVSVFNTRSEGYKALADYLNVGKKGQEFAIATAFQNAGESIASLQQALTETDWPGNPAAAAGYAASVAGNVGNDQTYQSYTAGGLYGAAGPTLSTTGKPPAQVIQINQTYGPNAAALANASQTKDYSAYETVQQELDRWGLAELAPFAYKAAMGGQNAEQIAADIRRSPQYNAAFPGMAERVKEGLPPLSEDAYITYEDSMLGIANKYSLPRGFITKTEIGKLVAQNVSPVEFSQRMDALSGVAIRADPLVRSEFNKFFGVKNGLGALTAYFADPNRATDLLTQQASAAQLAAQSGESGLGALDKTHAMRLTQLEYTEHLAPGTVRAAIDTASNWNYLRAGAPGSVAPKVSTGELIGAEVPGYNGSVAANRSAVKAGEGARESFLESGGGYEATPRGAVGVGGASTEGRGGA